MSNTYIVGQIIVVQDTITNPVSGLLTDDATDSVVFYKPDGTATAPLAGTRLSLGIYQAQVTLDQTGWWEYVWTATTTAAGKGRERVYVSPVP